MFIKYGFKGMFVELNSKARCIYKYTHSANFVYVSWIIVGEQSVKKGELGYHYVMFMLILPTAYVIVIIGTE